MYLILFDVYITQSLPNIRGLVRVFFQTLLRPPSSPRITFRIAEDMFRSSSTRTSGAHSGDRNGSEDPGSVWGCPFTPWVRRPRGGPADFGERRTAQRHSASHWASGQPPNGFTWDHWLMALLHSPSSTSNRAQRAKEALHENEKGSAGGEEAGRRRQVGGLKMVMPRIQNLKRSRCSTTRKKVQVDLTNDFD